MKKNLACTLLIMLFFADPLMAQNSETTQNAAASRFTTRQQVPKTENPAQDKTDQFEIQGLGGTTFTASNTYDGGMNSFKHSLLVTVTLVPINKVGTNNFQIVFYSESAGIPQAASYNGGILNVYYPISFYEGIKEKLEQSIAAKKKIFVKVIQTTTGYREGSLIF
jgi:hypothetical protein